MNQLSGNSLSSSEIASFLKVSKATVVGYYEKVRRAYFWLGESDLVIGNGNQRKYTKLCVEAMEELVASNNHEEWIIGIQSKKPDSYKDVNGTSPLKRGELKNIQTDTGVQDNKPGELAIPNFEPLEIEVLHPENVTKYNLNEISTANKTNISRLRLNSGRMLENLNRRTQEEFRMLGAAHAQQAIHAYTASFNEELSSLNTEYGSLNTEFE